MGLSWGAVEKFQKIWRFVWKARWGLVALLAVVCFVQVLWWLRHRSYFTDPMLSGYLEIVGGLIAFTYAANALVRFKGTHDRISLILAIGFVLSGLLEMSASVVSYRRLAEGLDQPLTIPLAWMVGRTLLGLLLVAALVVEKRLPSAPDPGREIAGTFLLVAAAAYLTSAVFLSTAGAPTIRPGALVPRPADLLPAAIFLAAAIGYQRRMKQSGWAFDRAICYSAALNVMCHLVASQSQHPFDAPLVLAQVLKVSSYALVLGGSLLDNARLFDQVRRLAVSDPLTGLANYRRFIDVLEVELERSGRTGRSFAVLLLDLDGLKKINDRLGHLVGTRAISRVADVLRSHCRSIDTAARYGGDEFVLVLPETSAEAAKGVARRVSERLANDGEQPALTVSLGVAMYPQDGVTIEALLSAADRALYKMKGRGRKKTSFSRVAAML